LSTTADNPRTGTSPVGSDREPLWPSPDLVDFGDRCRALQYGLRAEPELRSQYGLPCVVGESDGGHASVTFRLLILEAFFISPGIAMGQAVVAETFFAHQRASKMVSSRFYIESALANAFRVSGRMFLKRDFDNDASADMFLHSLAITLGYTPFHPSVIRGWFTDTLIDPRWDRSQQDSSSSILAGGGCIGSWRL
jgi:hypothetical protein